MSGLTWGILRERDPAVCRGPDHLARRLGGEEVGEEAPDDDGVVDDEDAAS